MFRRGSTSCLSIKHLFACSMSVVATLLFMVGFCPAQQSDDDNKNLEVRSNMGDLHVGNDPDAREIGLPVYPGARVHKADKDKSSANFSILTEAFGMKLLVANYDSDDSPDKLLAYYRDKLKKYGKVIECHTTKENGHVNVHDYHADDNGDDSNKPVSCDGDNPGPVVELKA
jgi:hypothetical protein